MEEALASLPAEVRLYVTGHSLGGALTQIGAAFDRPYLSAG